MRLTDAVRPAVDSLHTDSIWQFLYIDPETHGIGRVEQGDQMAKLFASGRQLTRLVKGVCLKGISLVVHTGHSYQIHA